MLAFEALRMLQPGGMPTLHLNLFIQAVCDLTPGFLGHFKSDGLRQVPAAPRPP
jgi:hypothetical protein